MKAPLRLCILISGNGSNLQSIINAVENGNLDARVVAVISNNPDAFGLTRAQNHGIPAWTINHRDYPQRQAFDLALKKQINESQADFVVLAGFMRILDSAFIQSFERRILNIHPSLLPRYKGLNTFQRALENGDSEHGVSIHLVTAELDDGPLLMQESFAISKDDSIADIQQKGHALEHQMYPALLRSLAEGELIIEAHDIFFRKQALTRPLTLQDVSSH